MIELSNSFNIIIIIRNKRRFRKIYFFAKGKKYLHTYIYHILFEIDANSNNNNNDYFV